MVHVIDVRNVCEALPSGLEYLLVEGRCEESRAGPVLVAPGPVVTVTQRPTERMLFSSVRDANPFFLLYEAVWCIAGRNDSAPLNEFVQRYGASYGETDGTVHGAYGYRWRQALGFDQIEHVVQTLRADYSSRQCVLQMWNSMPEVKLPHAEWSVGDDLRGKWSDRPCNLLVCLRVRDVTGGRALDIGVFCRSNDAIWGAHNANAVVFSVLQEYLAARIGVDVGVMTQHSFNYHAYATELDRLQKRALDEVTHTDGPLALRQTLVDDRYTTQNLTPEPLFTAPDQIDADVRTFCAWYDELRAGGDPKYLRYDNKWFQNTLVPAMSAHWHHKQKNWKTAMSIAHTISSPDWRVSCEEWIMRKAK